MAPRSASAVAGPCLVPAIADLAIAPAPATTFVVAMLGGMILPRLLPTAPVKQPSLETSNV